MRIYRRDTTTQKWVIHGYFPATATEEDISREFGGGEYWVQLMLPDPQTGREAINTSRKFKVPGSYRAPQGELPGIRREGNGAPSTNGAVPAVGTISSTGAPSDLMGMLNATMITTFMDMVKTMKEVSTRPAPSADPMLIAMLQNQSEMSKAQAATQQKIIEMMLAIATRDNGDSKKDVLSMMESMKNLIAAPAATSEPMDMFTKMLDAFTSMRDVAEDIAPRRANSGDPLTDTLPMLAKVISEEHEMRKQGRTRALPAATPATPNPPTTTEPAASLLPWQRIVRSQANSLLISAQRGVRPTLAASVAVEYLPTDWKGIVTEFFSRDPEPIVADLLQEIPQLAAYPKWLEEFVDEVQFILFPGDEEEIVEEPKGDEAKDGDE